MNKFLSTIERALSVAAAVALFAIMAIVAADVAMRYLLSAPFIWSYDLVSLYLELALFYFALSRTFQTHAHVGVDILHYYVTPRTRRIFETVTCAVAMPLFALIGYAGAMRAASAFAGSDVIAGAIAWPTWASIALVPLGAGILTLRLLANMILHATALATGRDTIALPPLARSAEGGDEVFE